MAVVQVMLGLRSLLVKLAIFFVMAALLAWALGGTLFPRPEIVDHSRVTFQGAEWWLRMLAGGDQPGAVRWYLMEKTGGKSFYVEDNGSTGSFNDAFGGSSTYQPGDTMGNTDVTVYEADWRMEEDKIK